MEKVLWFVSSKKIRMHQTSAKGTCPWRLPEMVLPVEGLFLSFVSYQTGNVLDCGGALAIFSLWFSNKFWVD